MRIVMQNSRNGPKKYTNKTSINEKQDINTEKDFSQSTSTITIYYKGKLAYYFSNRIQFSLNLIPKINQN